MRGRRSPRCCCRPPPRTGGRPASPRRGLFEFEFANCKFKMRGFERVQIVSCSQCLPGWDARSTRGKHRGGRPAAPLHGLFEFKIASLNSNLKLLNRWILPICTTHCLPCMGWTELLCKHTGTLQRLTGYELHNGFQVCPRDTLSSDSTDTGTKCTGSGSRAWRHEVQRHGRGRTGAGRGRYTVGGGAAPLVGLGVQQAHVVVAVRDAAAAKNNKEPVLRRHTCAQLFLI